MVQRKPKLGFQNHSNFPVFSAMSVMLLNKITLGQCIFVADVRVKTSCLEGSNIWVAYLD